MRALVVVLCLSFAGFYFSCLQPTAVGEVIERRGSVSFLDRLPFTSTVRGGDTVSVGAGSGVKIQTLGGLQLDLAALPGADGASIRTGYWWEMGGGPYLFVTLERGRLDVKVAGPARRRWTLEFKAPGVGILNYGPRMLDHAVQTDGMTTTVTTAQRSQSMEALRVSAEASHVSTSVEMALGDTLVVGLKGIQHRAGLPSPASVPAKSPAAQERSAASVTTDVTRSNSPR